MHVIADNATTCPHCGHRFNTLLAKIFFWVVGVPLLIAIAIGILSSG